MLPFTSLDAVTSTQVGEVRDLGGTRAIHGMLVSATGAPSAWTVALEGSHDGDIWVVLGSAGLAAGDTRYLLTPAQPSPVRYVRANLTTLTGGTSPTVTATIWSV